MKTAIVILNWNGKALLEQFLPNVIEHSQTDDVNIYVADNASTDDSIVFIEQHHPEIKIIKNEKNYGFAGGYNQALKAIEEELLVLLNSDIEVIANWLKPILNAFKADSKLAIGQPKILSHKNKNYFEYAGAGGGFIDKYGFPYCRGRVFFDLEKDEGQYNDTIDILWATGACLFIRNRIFKELNGFDEDYFAHHEEIDLCWRAFNKGLKIQYFGQATVYHVGGATLEAENVYKTYLNFRNSLTSLVKNLPTKKLFPVLFIRLALDGVASFRFLTQGKIKHLFAVLGSHVYFYWYLFKNLKKRDTNQRDDYFKTKSIVWEYFVKKKKTYSELE